jgi:hypothetical protein
VEKSAGDSDEGEKRIELTPEQTEVLLSSMVKIQERLDSQLKLSAFTLPESAFKNIIAFSGIVQAQPALLADAIKPILDAQAAWKKQISGTLASDAVRNMLLTHGRIADQLTMNLDLGGVAASPAGVSRSSTMTIRPSGSHERAGGPPGR